jgi:beta-glucosidase
LTEGRGECIWHRFSHTPGKVFNGDTGDVACDHLHRYKEDVALMAALGLPAYRFSISWPRVIPAGTGAPNPQGLDFYDSLIDELLRHNIDPYVTLYHWDYPQALQDRGGWTNPDSVKWFEDYTDLVTRRYGDRIKGWITFNEPWCVSLLSNMIGAHAPGLQDPRTAYEVAHYLNIAHGAGMRVIRQNCPGVPAGITLNLSPNIPATDSEEDATAAQIYDGYFNRWFLDPVFKGTYPDDILELLTPLLMNVDIGALKTAAEPMDFIGVNYYTRAVIKADNSNPLGFGQIRPPESDYTEMEWEIYPQGLTDLLLRVTRDYAPKGIIVTENGAAFIDPAPVNGVVDDPDRVAYIEGHLKACETAITLGVPLKGYFLWSLLDNFEWAFGYSKRFGIIQVDYDTQVRTPKASAHFYRDIITHQVV